jgi:hypothetical protein
VAGWLSCARAVRQALDAEAKNSDPEVLEQRQALSSLLLADDGPDGGAGDLE